MKISNYERIIIKKLSLDESFLAKQLNFVRKEPRLAEVVVEHLRDFWWKYDANKLVNKTSLENRRILKLFVDMINEYCSGVDNEDFIAWKNIILNSKSKVFKRKIYFFLLDSNFIKKDQKNNSYKIYEKYGFYCHELLFNKGIPKKILTRDSSFLKETDKMKIEVVARIVEIKESKNLSNLFIAKAIGKDETILGKIINSKVDGISLEYLVDVKDRMINLL